MEQPRIVGICGSLRDGSYALRALNIALGAAEDSGANTTCIDLKEYDIPIFSPDHDDPEDVEEIRAAVDAADAVILATPMYHGSYSSPIKTILDYMGFDELEGKTVGLLCVSGGRFPITALEHLRSVCRAIDMWVLPYEAAVPQAKNYFDGDTLVDEELRERVEKLGVETVRFARVEPYSDTFESHENIGAVDR